MTALLLIFGLAIGSFLNVVAMRYQQTPSSKEGGVWFGGRSHCPHCQKTLQWYELIPLFSFLIQGGRCRSCKHKLSWQYPIVELTTGGAFALIGFLNPIIGPISLIGLIRLIIFLSAAAILILIAAIDYRLYIIPDGLSLSLAILGLVNAVLVGNFANHFLAGLLGVAFFGFVVAITRGKGMGMGDVKLAGGIGLLLGFPDAVFAFALAFVVGALWGVTLMLFGKKGMKDMLPFGPFLVIGVFLSLLLAPYISAYVIV